jgi:hypothetical protein
MKTMKRICDKCEEEIKGASCYQKGLGEVCSKCEVEIIKEEQKRNEKTD